MCISPQMFTTVDVINKNDLAPAHEEPTRSPHVVTGAVSHKAGGDFLLGSEFSSPSTGQRREEGSGRTVFPSARDLPLFPLGLGQRFRPAIRHRPGGRCTLRPGEQGAAHSLPCLLGRRKRCLRDAFVQINHQAGRSRTSGVQPLPSGFKVTDPIHRVLFSRHCHTLIR